MVGIAAGLGAIMFRYLIHSCSIVLLECSTALLGWMSARRIIVIPARFPALVVATVICRDPLGDAGA